MKDKMLNIKIQNSKIKIILWLGWLHTFCICFFANSRCHNAIYISRLTVFDGAGHLDY
jgi:hypothetical protein